MHLFRVETPLGPMRLAAEEEGLCGLWFEGANRAPSFSGEERDDAVIRQAKRWLALYFSGRAPDFTPPLHLTGTAFQRAVWERLLAIPRGETLTYGALADSIAAEFHRVPAGSAGGRPGGGAQSRRPHRAVPPRGGRFGKAHGLRRGPCAEGGAAPPRGRGSVPLFSLTDAKKENL